MLDQETIVAEATPRGRGAISIIRISGPLSFHLVHKLLQNRSPVPSTTRYIGNIYDGGAILDKVLIQYYQGPRSYTGDDMAEISCHGNPTIVDRIINNLLSGDGVRMARPGEFTQKAFLNGKIGLGQAEAVMGIVGAGTVDDVKLATDVHIHGISHEIKALAGSLIQILAKIEAHIDFPDDLPELRTESIMADIHSVLESLRSVLRRCSTGEKQSPMIILYGERNAGKSTLFNALLGYDRAIVDSSPGTTRDYLEENMEIDGMAVRIVDTAGVGENPSGVEELGINMGLSLLHDADLIIHLIDASRSVEVFTSACCAVPASAPPTNFHSTPQNPSPQLASFSKHPDFAITSMHSPQFRVPRFLGEQGYKNNKVINVYNKIDLLNGSIEMPTDGVMISALLGGGLDDLKSEIKMSLINQISADGDTMWISNRQNVRLEEAENSLNEAVSSSEGIFDIILVAEHIRTACAALRGACGEIVTDDVVRSIFSNFCVGK